MSTNTVYDNEDIGSSDYAATPTLIKEGLGATLRTSAGGLYVPYTVVAVRRNGRELDLQRDKTIVEPGSNDFADYGPRTYERDTTAKIVTVSLRNDGTFIEKGSPKEWYSTRYYMGLRRDWTDYSQ